MSLHRAEEILKKGSLKAFVSLVEETNVDIFERGAFLFRQAIQYGQYPILRYLFLGEYHTLYDPKRPETLDPVLMAVKMTGRPVFELPILGESYLAESDHVGIFDFLRAFGYDVTRSSCIRDYRAHQSFNILTHILTNSLVPAKQLLAGGELEHDSFEVLALLNTKVEVKLRGVTYSPSWTDERLHLFRRKTHSSVYNLDNLEMAVRDNDVEFVREYLSNFGVPPTDGHNRLIQFCEHNTPGFAILKLFFSHGVLPGDLADFIKYHSSFRNEPGASFTKAALNISHENSRVLLRDNPGILEMLLRDTADYLYFLVSNNLILLSAENATTVLRASSGKKRAMEYMIALYQYGFPVLDLDLQEVFPDSATRVQGTKVIQDYLKSLSKRAAEDPAVVGAGAEVQGVLF